MCNETKNLKDTNSETRGSKFAIAISREFPIPGIPWNSREFPGIPSSNSRPETREWNFSLPFLFPKMGMEFYGIFIPVPVFENGNGICHFPFPFPKSKSHSRSWLLWNWFHPTGEEPVKSVLYLNLKRSRKYIKLFKNILLTKNKFVKVFNHLF